MASSSHAGQKINGKGRQKVKMVKMEKKSNLQVTFSKRRYGLFKKASELCTLTGAEIGVIVYSPGRKVFSFGDPSVHKIVNKCFPRRGFLSYDVKEGARGVTAQGGRGCDERMVDAHRTASVAELNMRLSVLELETEAEKGRVAALEERERAEIGGHAPMDKMGAGELEELGASLHALKERVALMGRLAGVGQDLQGFKPDAEMGNPAGFINPMGVPGYGYGYGYGFY